MKFVIILTAILASASSSDLYATSGVTVGLTPYAHPVQSLYHAQDNHGQYVYGYATPTSTKTETKTADGVTRGGYSYIDSHGILQSVEYVSDPVHGFRVAATNLPQDLPDVAYARSKHLEEFNAIKAEHLAARTVHYSNPVAVPYSAVPTVPILNIPQPVHDLPEVAAAKANHLAQYEAIKAQHLSSHHTNLAPVQDLPEVIKARAEHLAAVEATKARNAAINAGYIGAIGPVGQLSGHVVPIHVAPAVAAPALVANSEPLRSYSPIVYASQYQTLDEHGQYTYGYAGPLSSKAESKSADGVTRGGYSYIDANGILQTVHYISDPVNGFRVAATNLPVGPSVVAPEVKVDISDSTSHDLYTHNVYY